MFQQIMPTFENVGPGSFTPSAIVLTAIYAQLQLMNNTIGKKIDTKGHRGTVGFQ